MRRAGKIEVHIRCVCGNSPCQQIAKPACPSEESVGGNAFTGEARSRPAVGFPTLVKAPLNKVWDAWNNPADIKQWNAAQDDWHTTKSVVDLREGGKFSARMEAKDGSMGFDFEGTYTRVVPKQAIQFCMSDGRKVQVDFIVQPAGVLVKETFDAETENTPEVQRQGWQAILDNFARHVESRN